MIMTYKNAWKLIRADYGRYAKFAHGGILENLASRKRICVYILDATCCREESF